MSTTDVVRARQVRHWQSVINDVYVPLEFRPGHGEIGFAADLEVHTIDGMEFSRLRADPHAVLRSPGTIDQGGAGCVFVMLPRSGQLVIEQDGRVARLRPGDLASYDAARPCLIESRERFDLTVAKLPLDAFRAAGFPAPPRSSTAVPVDRDSVLGSLASSFLGRVGDLCGRGGHSGHTGAPGIGTTTVSLVSATFAGVGPSGDGRSALRRRADGIISDRLGDPALDPPRLAAALHVSLRTLQLAFAEVGHSPARTILARRLDRGAHLLRDAAHARRSITDIAFAVGFDDSSQFSRAFRSRFECPPRAYRLRESPDAGALGDR